MTLSKLAILRPIAAAMLLIFLIMLGGIGFSRMSVDLFPSLEHPYLMISTHVDHFSPDEMELRVTAPLEQLLSTLPNLSSIHTQSTMGQSIITLKFQWGTSMRENKERVKEKLETIRARLPKDTPEPAILPFDPAAMPIMQWVISQKKTKDTDVKKIAERKIIPYLQNIDGVATVALEGITERQFQIHLYPERLKVHGLSYEQIKTTLITQNINLPSGQITQDNQVQSIQIIGNYASLYDLSQLKIPTKNGMIPLQELAMLKEITVPKGHISYINGQPCIGLSIFKAEGKNSVHLAKQIEKQMQVIEKDLDKNITLEIVFNQSDFINQAISAIYSAICLGGISAAAVLYIFLRNMRSTLTIFLTIPITLSICFFFMYLLGQDLNLLTLGALSLGVGMMIDNAIVMVESIEQQSIHLTNPKEAVLSSANQMFSPMLASTFTSIIVFVPFLFIHGLISQIFFPLAIVVILSQLTSLLTSFLFIPLIASRPGKRKEVLRKNRLAKKYKAILPIFIQHPKVMIMSLLVLLSLSIFAVKFLEVEFMPHQDQSFIIVHTQCPTGITLDNTEQIALGLLNEIKKIPEVRSVYSTIGGSPSATSTQNINRNTSHFYCLLHKKKHRKATDLQIAKKIMHIITQHTEIRYSLSVSDPGFFDSQMKIRILNANRMNAIAVAQQLTQQLKEINGVSQIQVQGIEETPALSIQIQEGKAALLGMDRTLIAQQLYSIFNGEEICRLLNQKEDIPIQLFLSNREGFEQANSLEQLNLYSPIQGAIPLKSIADIQPDNQVSQQFRYNQQPQILISYEMQAGQKQKTTQQIKQVIAQLESEHPSSHFLIDGQYTQIKESFQQMKFICCFAFVFIYMILAAQFESLLIPFVLIFSIPVVTIGVVFSLLLFHQPVSASSFIGILLLIGVVINNAILLLDSIMQQVKKGIDLKQAILIGAPSRIRPIFMTACTTILGVLPLLLGTGEGIEFQRPMSLVIVFGLISSTFITLVLIPSILMLLEKRVTLSWRKKG